MLLGFCHAIFDLAHHDLILVGPLLFCQMGGDGEKQMSNTNRGRAKSSD
jgi:hypothetical protein